jgi:hypothetical protein
MHKHTTRGRLGKFLLGLASTVILVSESHVTHNHILLSHDPRSRTDGSVGDLKWGYIHETRSVSKGILRRRIGSLSPRLYTPHASPCLGHYTDTLSLRRTSWTQFKKSSVSHFGVRGSIVVKALCCKPEGRGFKSRLVGFFLNWPNPSGRIMALGSTQPLAEMSTRNLKK